VLFSLGVRCVEFEKMGKGPNGGAVYKKMMVCYDVDMDLVVKLSESCDLRWLVQLSRCLRLGQYNNPFYNHHPTFRILQLFTLLLTWGTTSLSN
jgi:hypothetical protein